MTLKQVHCPILQAQVTVVTDLEGAIERGICSEYLEPAGTGRLKSRGAVGGPLARLLARGDGCEVRA